MTLGRITELSELDPEGTYLWVIHADKIPPHLGLSARGKFYSLKVSGLDRGLPVDRLLGHFDRKLIPILFILLESIPLEYVDSVYGSYSEARDGEDTCLSPIKELMNMVESNTIHDLIEGLNANGQVKGVYGKNLPFDYEGIPEYEIEAVNSRLRKLLE